MSREELVLKLDMELEKWGDEGSSGYYARHLAPFIERLLAQEREKMREMCAEYLEKEAAKCAGFAEIEAGERRAAWNRAESWYEDSADAIRQLDLTAPGNT